MATTEIGTPPPQWTPDRWWRVILSDGTVWCETSNEAEARYALGEVRSTVVTTHPSSAPPEGIRHGPDPAAKLQRIHTFALAEWRDVEEGS